MQNLGGITVLLCLAAAWFGFCLGASAEPPKPQEPGPVEIDFFPLSSKDITAQYKIRLDMKAKSGAEFKEVYTVDARSSVGAVLQTVKVSVTINGWNAKTVGEGKLVIEGYKDSPLKEIKLTTEGLPKGADPTVRRVKPKKEK